MSRVSFVDIKTKQELAQVAQRVNVLEDAKIKKYGVRRVLNATTPILERLYDAKNLVANAGIGAGAAVNDFDKVYPWSKIRNCIRTAAGKIYYENEPGYDTAEGDWLVEIPIFYLSITQTATQRDTTICELPLPGFWVPNIFKNENGTISTKAYVGRFKASVDAGGVIQSKPNTIPATVRSRTSFRSLAQAKGSGWQLIDGAYIGEVLHPLYMIEFAHLNSQQMLGEGIISMRYTATDLTQLAEVGVNRVVLLTANSDYYRVGEIIGIGTSQGGNQVAKEREILSINVIDGLTKEIIFDGAPVNIAIGNMVYNVAQKTGESLTIKASSGQAVPYRKKASVKYRGIEDPYANVHEWIDGILIQDFVTYACEKPSKYADTITADFKALGYKNWSGEAYVGGYWLEAGFDRDFPYINLPTTAGGWSTTGYCDYYEGSPGLRAPFLGGNFAHSVNAGLFYWSCYSAASTASIHFGARLLQKPGF